VKLKDTVAIVTGGGSGIGLATAYMLAEKGAKVVIADVSKSNGEKGAAQIRSCGLEGTFLHVDVADLESVKQLFAATNDIYGRLDVLFNNAGVLGGPRFPEAKPDTWLRAIDINLVGVMNCIHVGVPYLRACGGGVIVNTASTAGLKSSHLDPAYAATKAAVVSLTRSLTFLQTECGIRINCVCPALVKTALEHNSGAQYDEADRNAFKQRRLGRLELPSLTPEEVALAALRVIEDESLNGYACKVVVGEPWELIPSVEPQKVR
jgi:NAD(P)-dependent dehydrogenase (short-subunit alcohol dehydrogenase family)